MNRSCVMVSLGFLMGCATGPVPELGPLGDGLLRDAYRLSLREGTPREAALTTTAFARFQGMTQAQAVAALEADGFMCGGSTCQFDNAERIGWFAINFGITTYADPYTVYRTYTVAFSGDPISNLRDVQMTVRSRIEVDP